MKVSDMNEKQKKAFYNIKHAVMFAVMAEESVVQNDGQR